MLEAEKAYAKSAPVKELLYGLNRANPFDLYDCTIPRLREQLDQKEPIIML